MHKISHKLEFLFQLDKANSIISRRFNGQGLGFSDLAVLFAISNAQDGKIRRVDLAGELGLTASGVTRLLLPLEKIGVIKREINERDARVSYAMLTSSGKRMLSESLVRAEELCDDLLTPEKSKHVSEFTKILNGITNY